MDLRIEAESESSASCDCCGNKTRSVTGFISTPERTIAAYIVHWTVGQVDSHGAHFDFIVGAWGEGASREDRFAVSLELRRLGGQPQLMVIDAPLRPVASSTLVGGALPRDEVIGTPIAEQIFTLVDAVWLQDARISELLT